MTADELFRKGLEQLREDNRLGALGFFEKAYEREKRPEIESYLGRLIALERGQITDAVNMCKNAIAYDETNPVHYLNLGKVYLKAKRNHEAMESFRKGLSYGENKEIREILEIIGMRKKPLIPFLSRKNILNKYTGILLSWLKLR